MSKLKIAICEDNPAEFAALSTLLDESSFTVESEHFPEGGAFLQNYHPGRYDLVLLDIYMEGMGGIETVERLRAIDTYVPVAFMTTSLDYALDGYRFQVARYMLKPLKAADIHELLTYTQGTKRLMPGMSIRSDGKYRFLTFRSISYIEQSNHQLIFHLADGERLESRGKLDALAKDVLPASPFFRCHKSFIVNLMHVYRLNEELNIFEMNNGDAVYIRRQSMKDAADAFHQFMFAHIRREI